MGGRKDLITAGLTLGSLAAAEEKAKCKMSAIIATESGSAVSFTAADAAPVADLTAAIVPVQSGSGDPSPTNIRPISGWTECNVTRAGKNLAPAEIPSNIIAGTFTTTSTKITSATYARVFAFSVPKNTTLYVQKLSGDTTGHSVALGDTGEIEVNTPLYSPAGLTNSFGFTIDTGEHGWMYVQSATLAVAESLFTTSEFMVSAGSTRQTYAPSSAKTYTVTFGSAGTVYGGTVDPISGTLPVTMANIASYNGETLPGAWISDRDVYAEGTTPTIGAQVVYELAEPLVYNLSPVEIRTLAGQNTIWADTGDVTVKYTADTKAFIDKYIAARRNG